MTTNSKHIALVGKMGAGKSTIAADLVERHGYKKLALADQVKDDCADMLDFIVGRNANPTAITRHTIDLHKREVFRPLLQWYGTDFWRVFMKEPEHWINILIRKVRSSTVPVVVDDVRFKNEVYALRANGFTVIKVIREDDERLAQAGTAGIAGHASEAEIDDIQADLEFVNTTLEDLPKSVDAMMKLFGQRVYIDQEYVNRLQESVPYA